MFVTGLKHKIHTKISYHYKQRHLIIMTDDNNDNILDEIERREKSSLKVM